MTASLDRKVFFAAVRLNPFPGHLTPGQVSGMGAMLDAAPPDMDLDSLAYCFATAPIETGWTMLPALENLNYTTAANIRRTWLTRFASEAAAAPYVRNPKALAIKVYGGRMGNAPAPSEDGWIYRGAGLVQSTGEENAIRATKRLRELGYLTKDQSFVTNPELYLVPILAAAVMFIGMEEGWFTGKKLSDFFRAGRADAVGARAIINGNNKAAEFALHWKGFRSALEKAGYKPGAVVSKIPVPPVIVNPISENPKMPEIKSNGDVPVSKPETSPAPKPVVVPADKPLTPPKAEPPKTLAEAIRRRIFGVS
jgi:putative chitinase